MNYKNSVRSPIYKMSSLLAVSLFSFSASAESVSEDIKLPVDKVLTQIKHCSESITIRSQKLTAQQQKEACEMLSEQEAFFHGKFNTKGKPVKHDGNTRIQVNVYHNRDEYVKHGTNHFGMSTDNGGMYLEGLPDVDGNEANFITYQKGDVIWNLRHEYVHYLDGRFNLYGDFCASLHDSHSPPENCAKPAPLYPHTVWWSEGVAEYVAKRDVHPRAFKSLLKEQGKYKLSELFDTSYENNGGGARVYHWGYAAVRFMMENERDKVEEMLQFLRVGDYVRYQSLVRSWGNSMDKNFDQWLASLVKDQSENLAGNK